MEKTKNDEISSLINNSKEVPLTKHNRILFGTSKVTPAGGYINFDKTGRNLIVVNMPS